MGILSHQDIAPLALSAANEASDRLINSFLPLSSNMDASQEAQPKSQHERCKQFWEDQQNDLLTTLDDPERKCRATSTQRRSAPRIGDGRLSFGKVGLLVELSWNDSRTRVGVAELSAGRVAWARDAEAMSRLGNYGDFSMTFSDFQ